MTDNNCIKVNSPHVQYSDEFITAEYEYSSTIVNEINGTYIVSIYSILDRQSSIIC